MTSGLDIYLAQLRRELKKRGLFDQRIVEEARGHLTDATEQAVRRGLSRDAAEREAIARFGTPKQAAMTFASERYRLTNWLLSVSAAVVMMLQRLLAHAGGHDAHRGFEFHDRQTPFHLLVRSKKGWVNPELVAIASDPATQLVPFLQRVAPAPLGPLGQAESVSVLERESAPDAKTYRVVFGGHRKIVCTVTVRSDGRGASLDWTRVVTK